MNNFISFSKSPGGKNIEIILNNLKAQAPAVATAVYLLGKDLITQNLLIWFLISLVAGALVQYFGDVKLLTIIFAAVAFFLWVWGMGGVFDELIPLFFGPATKTVIILAYHTVLTALANRGTV